MTDKIVDGKCSFYYNLLAVQGMIVVGWWMILQCNLYMILVQICKSKVVRFL